MTRLVEDVTYGKDLHGNASYPVADIQYIEDEVSRYLWSYVAPVLIAVGTIGSMLSLLVLCRKSMRGQTTMFYLACLAVADVAVLYTGLFRLWVENRFGWYIRLDSSLACKLHTFCVYLFLDTSVWLTAAVSLDRCLYVSLPYQAKRWCTIQKSRGVVVCILLTMAAINCHFFWTYDRESGEQESILGNSKYSCYVTEGSEVIKRFIKSVWPWIDFGVFCIIPFLVMSITTFIIVKHLVRSDKKMAAHRHISQKTTKQNPVHDPTRNAIEETEVVNKTNEKIEKLSEDNGMYDNNVIKNIITDKSVTTGDSTLNTTTKNHSQQNVRSSRQTLKNSKIAPLAKGHDVNEFNNKFRQDSAHAFNIGSVSSSNFLPTNLNKDANISEAKSFYKTKTESEIVSEGRQTLSMERKSDRLELERNARNNAKGVGSVAKHSDRVILPKRKKRSRVAPISDNNKDLKNERIDWINDIMSNGCYDDGVGGDTILNRSTTVLTDNGRCRKYEHREPQTPSKYETVSKTAESHDSIYYSRTKILHDQTDVSSKLKCPNAAPYSTADEHKVQNASPMTNKDTHHGIGNSTTTSYQYDNNHHHHHHDHHHNRRLSPLSSKNLPPGKLPENLSEKEKKQRLTLASEPHSTPDNTGNIGDNINITGNNIHIGNGYQFDTTISENEIKSKRLDCEFQLDKKTEVRIDIDSKKSESKDKQIQNFAKYSENVGEDLPEGMKHFNDCDVRFHHRNKRNKATPSKHHQRNVSVSPNDRGEVDGRMATFGNVCRDTDCDDDDVTKHSTRPDSCGYDLNVVNRSNFDDTDSNLTTRRPIVNGRDETRPNSFKSKCVGDETHIKSLANSKEKIFNCDPDRCSRNRERSSIILANDASSSQQQGNSFMTLNDDILVQRLNPVSVNVDTTFLDADTGQMNEDFATLDSDNPFTKTKSSTILRRTAVVLKGSHCTDSSTDRISHIGNDVENDEIHDNNKPQRDMRISINDENTQTLNTKHKCETMTECGDKNSKLMKRGYINEPDMDMDVAETFRSETKHKKRGQRCQNDDNSSEFFEAETDLSTFHLDDDDDDNNDNKKQTNYNKDDVTQTGRRKMSVDISIFSNEIDFRDHLGKQESELFDNHKGVTNHDNKTWTTQKTRGTSITTSRGRLSKGSITSFGRRMSATTTHANVRRVSVSGQVVSSHQKASTKTPGVNVRLRGSTSTKSSQTTSISVTLITLSTVFWLLNSPIMIFIIGYTYWTEGATDHQKRLLGLGWTVVNLLQYSNCAGHVILYCLTSPRFRQELVTSIKSIVRRLTSWC